MEIKIFAKENEKRKKHHELSLKLDELKNLKNQIRSDIEVARKIILNIEEKKLNRN